MHVSLPPFCGLKRNEVWVYQDFHTSTFLPIGTKVEAERLLLYERWDFLCKLEMVGEEGAFVIGREEVLTEEELAATLKVI